jgi:hypothetical protein
VEGGFFVLGDVKLPSVIVSTSLDRDLPPALIELRELAHDWKLGHRPEVGQISGRMRDIGTPMIAATLLARRCGTCRHWLTACGEIPSRAASARFPPAISITRCNSIGRAMGGSHNFEYAKASIETCERLTGKRIGWPA